ncbi:hypothetical protein [Methylobacterium sp. WL19]|uniref:hypothetical protein n=1 Tax=Methylobacterium sp. WL19 TaxID=2603896 RepID=UPI0011C7CF91|nr:hypothetical protein [Methylobacterium sp. WL19]TXN33936.1 hypothetical protein FV220_00365 [Methylobacterium sp. WL19]
MDDQLLIIIATIITCMVIAGGILLQARNAARSQTAANDNPWDVTAITIAILGPGLLAADLVGVIWLGRVWL